MQRLTLDNVLQITRAITRSTVEVLGACNIEYVSINNVANRLEEQQEAEEESDVSVWR